MEDSYQRAAVARQVRSASTSLLEASEGAYQLQRLELSSQLLDQAVQLDNVARQLLDLPRKPPRQEQLLDVPF